jgi:uncharacterized protein YxeA
MKKVTYQKIALLMALAFAAFAATAQKVVTDANGNFVAAPKTVVNHDSTTQKTYTDAKGQVSPVFVSKSGKFYVWKMSKAGNRYRSYLQLPGEKK